MKTIGLLGGMSWESSHDYHRLLHEGVRDALGGWHSARLVLYALDFAEVKRLQHEDRWDEAAELLLAAGRAVERAGADFVVLATNTMHKVAEPLAAGLDIPLLHLGDATAAAITGAGVKRVGLLGTGFTMEQDFYTGRLARHGLDVLVPEAADRELVHRVIYDELVLGQIRDESRQAYRDVIGRLGIILGCTEIELLVGAEDSPVPVFPTTRLHAEAAVAYALGRADLPAPPDE